MMRRCAPGCATSPVQRRRFGYRRLYILMIWEALHMNHKKLRRLYCEERLQVRRAPRPQAEPSPPGSRWRSGKDPISAGTLRFPVRTHSADGRHFRQNRNRLPCRTKEPTGALARLPLCQRSQ